MVAWGGNHFSPLLLLYGQVHGYSTVQVNLAFAFYILGLIPGFLIAGPISDQHGRKRLLALALALGMLASGILGVGGASVAALCAGRLLSGASVAIGMVVGTSWIKELSQHDADPSLRARRASLTLTAGFGLGAGISGALAEWAPAPTLLPYVVHVTLSLAAAPPMLLTRDTSMNNRPARSILADLSIPLSGRRRFLGIVAPMAPWVFAAPALAFVVGPALLAPSVATWQIAFAALTAVVTLAVGALVQPLVPVIDRLTRGHHGVAGLAIAAAATAVLGVGAHVGAPVLAVAAAGLFGSAFGICIVAGLVEVQAMADPGGLAGLTGIYYSLTYLGFALPVTLAEAAHLVPYEVLLAAVSVAALVCATIVARTVDRGPRPAL